MPTLPLTRDEANFLAAFLGRIIGWDSRAAVRLQVRRRTLGVYAACPLDVLVFIALPLSGAAAQDSADEENELDGLDVTVSAGRLRDIIGDVTRLGERTQLAVPDPVIGSASLAVLPPVSPWSPGDRGVAGDLVQRIDEAVTAFRAQVPATGSLQSDLLAEATWSAPGWGGLPMRALHAAKLMGFLSHPGARLETGTAPGWKRLVSPAGQVFVRGSGVPARLSVVRNRP